MQRTIIYARVSTEDQVEKYGLPAQLRACRDYAAAHGFEVIEEITDDGISGDLLDRPGLNLLRERARSRAADVLLMLDPDRLSRVVFHAAMLKREFDTCGQRVAFVTTTFEQTPAGTLFYHMKASFSEYERTVIRDRTMRGKLERAKSGLLVGGRVCYGYRYTAGTLEPDPERAPIAQGIFAWFDSGLTMRSIALRLRAQGAPTWSGRKWGHSSVERILTNETYAGVAHYLRSKRLGKTRVLRPEAERISLAVPPLVSRELWERVQARIAERRADGNRPGGRPSAACLLSGILWCTCGRRMNGERSRKSHAYRCSGRDALRFSGGPCRCSVSAAKLDAAVWRDVVETFGDAARLRSLIAEHESAMRKIDPSKTAQLEDQARRLKRREENALALLIDPDFVSDRAAIKRDYQEAQRERARVESELALARRVVAMPSAGGWINEIVGLLREDLENMGALPDRQAFVRALVNRAEWDGEVLKMRCFIGPKLGTMSWWSAQNPDSIEVSLNVRLAV